MLGKLQVAFVVQASFLLFVLPVPAQLQFGETTNKANGTISSGYTASYGNMADSTHGWTIGGAANLTGSFHDPNFLSYNASFYLNQSRANSNFQSISDASGFNISTNIFNGSKFPGSISYSKAYDSEGNYAVPGLANYVTHGNSDTLGINWNENLPDVPSFSVGYQLGSSRYTVYGTSDEGNNNFHSVTLHSGYQIQGFNMGAYYTNGGAHSVVPEVVAGALSTDIHSSNNATGFNVSHLLPLHGSFSTGFNRSTWSSSYLGYRSNGTIDTVNMLAAVHPINKLSLSASANYSDNLAGQLIESVLNAGSTIPLLNSNESSDSLDVMGVASYTIDTSMQTSAFAERRTQHFLGEDYGVNSYGGNATYSHGLLNGTFNVSGGVTANSSDNTGADTLGFSATANYSDEILGWHLTESFGYSQNAQTLLVTYMNSFYNYSASARRRWGQFNMSLGAGGGRTALTEQAGTANSSETYNASIGYGAWITGTGSYSRSSGQALATGSGLIPVPVPSPTVPNDLLSLFGGESYSFGLSSTPVKKLILAAAYAKSRTNTTSDTITSSNQNNEFNTLIQYQYRKLYFTSGYSRLEQGFTITGTKPEVLSTYYVGVSRWFNFF